jgi:hypothetical protein
MLQHARGDVQGVDLGTPAPQHPSNPARRPTYARYPKHHLDVTGGVHGDDPARAKLAGKLDRERLDQPTIEQVIPRSLDGRKDERDGGAGDQRIDKWTIADQNWLTSRDARADDDQLTVQVLNAVAIKDARQHCPHTLRIDQAEPPQARPEHLLNLNSPRQRRHLLRRETSGVAGADDATHADAHYEINRERQLLDDLDDADVREAARTTST